MRKENDNCPHCEIGAMRIRISKFGEFLACDQFPRCAYKENINTELDVGQAGYKM